MTLARRSRILAVACTLALMSSFNPRLRAQAPGRVARGLQQYGEVTLRDLPRGAVERSERHGLPFLPTNPEAFRHQKTSRLTIDAPLASAVAGAPTLAITDGGFDGVSFADGGAIPPDTQIAVGPNHVFEAVNDWVRVWSRQTSPPSEVYDVDLGTFFGVGFLTTLTDIVSDPRVIYDPVSDRWFVSCVTLETYLNEGDWRLAVSKTNDPMGAYTLYAGSFSGSFPDFPSLGLSDDKLVLTGDAFSILTGQFIGSEFLVENKAQLVAGASTPAGVFFGPPQAVDTIQAANSLSPTSTLYLAAVPADGLSSRLQIWSLNGVPGVGNGVTMSTTSLTMQTTLVVPPNAVQPNSSIGIATNDTRLLNLVYRDGWLWMGGATGCIPAGDTSTRACLHFVQVDAAAQAVTQEILFGEPGVDYYYPAVTLDSNDNMVTVFNRSSASEFASVYTSGHNASDAAGALQAPTLVHAGLAVYDPSPYDPRWGDYSGISVDPLDGASIWVAGEYMRADGGMDWGTWIAKVSAGGGCALPSTPTGLVATPGDAQVALNWNASSGAASYTVKRAAVSGGPYTTIASGVAATTYTDTGLTNGTTYYYVVSATNACGDSATSAEASATPICLLPSAPTGLSATPGDAQVALNWTASSGAVSYTVKRAAVSGGPYTTIASGVAATTYTDTGLADGMTYYYVVSATNACGDGADSAEVSAMPTAVQAPAAPTKLSAVGPKGKVKLSWTQSTSPGVTQNRIYRSTTSGGTYTMIASIGANTSYTDTQVVGGTTYYYVVTAISSSGESVPSNQASAKPK